MIVRGRYVLSQFGSLAESYVLLSDGYAAGGAAVARRDVPGQFMHYHRAGCGAATSPQTRSHTAFVHAKIAGIIAAWGAGCEASERVAEAEQEWEVTEAAPIILCGMNALCLPALFETLGHSNVILTAGGSSFGHKDGPKQGATSCRQASGITIGNGSRIPRGAPPFPGTSTK